MSDATGASSGDIFLAISHTLQAAHLTPWLCRDVADRTGWLALGALPRLKGFCRAQVAVIELLGQEKWQEALDLAKEVQEKSRKSGVKATEASAATCLVVAQRCQESSQARQGLDALLALGATWNEAALLVTTEGGSGPWAAARALAPGSEELRRLCQELGLYWSERKARTAQDLISARELQVEPNEAEVKTLKAEGHTEGWLGRP